MRSWSCARSESRASDMTNATQRPPKPPPFPVGTKLRCVADRGESYAPRVYSARDMATHPEDWIRISGKGIEVVIDTVKLGRRGTGRQLVDSDGPMFYDDAECEPIIDTTKDGYSVYHVTIPDLVLGKPAKHGRIIHYENRKDWKAIK